MHAVELTYEKQILKVYIKGNLMWENVSDSGKIIIPVLHEDKPIQGVIINLEETGYIDSSGYGLILEIFSLLKERDAKLALCCMKPKNESTFEILGIKQFIKKFDSEADAITYIKEQD